MQCHQLISSCAVAIAVLGWEKELFYVEFIDFLLLLFAGDVCLPSSSSSSSSSFVVD